MRDIHWPKTAAAGRPIARERRKEGARAVRIDVPNKVPAPSGGKDPLQQVEEAIRRAAWLCLDALREGAQVHLVAQEVTREGPRSLMLRPGSGAADRALAFLARLPPEPVVPEDARAQGGGASLVRGA